MLYIPIQVIAFFMATMMVPEDVNQFTIAVYGKEIQWTRQESGWQAVELPRDDVGTFSVKGTEITISGEGHVLKTNISRFLSLPDDIDWKKAEEIQVALKSLGDPVQIQREDGKIVLSQAKGELFEKPVTISWQPVNKVVNQEAGAPEAVGALPRAAGEAVFEVRAGEATVDDDLIKRFSVGEKAVTASYQNKSEVKMRPRYTIELYNAQGILLGEDTTGGASGLFGGGPGYIDPGEVGSEDLRVTWYPVDRILSKSAVALPDDWKSVKWIVLKDNKPRSMGTK